MSTLQSVFEMGKSVIERLFPDPLKRAEEIRKLEELRQNGNIAELNAHVRLMLAQVKVNLAEAKSGSFFIAGWRPFIGWVGGISLAYQFLIYQFLVWGWTFSQAKGWIPIDLAPPPVIDSEVLYTIVTSMLGIAGMRSYDKFKGTQTDKI